MDVRTGSDDRPTLDRVDASADGHGWTEGSVAVVDVSASVARQTVSIRLEIDPATLDRLPHHADELSLAPGEARFLAAELEAAAATAAPDDDGGNGSDEEPIRSDGER